MNKVVVPVRFRHLAPRNCMKQEFQRGDLVWVRDEYWNDFGSGFKENLIRHPAHFSIIQYSYHDRYGGDEHDKHIYSELLLDAKGQPQYSRAWLHAELIEVLVLPRCIETLNILDKYPRL